MKTSIIVILASLLSCLGVFQLLDWEIPPAPESFPSLKYGGKWEAVLDAAVSAFYENPAIYDKVPSSTDPGLLERDPAYFRQIVAAYGVLRPANNYNKLPNYNKAGAYDDMMLQLFEIMKSDELRDVAYKWAKPVYIEAFKKIPDDYQRIYIEIGKHAVDYLDDFSYRKEKRYLKKLRKANEEWKFTIYAPDGSKPVYRKIEAFIYRRIDHKDMSKKELQEWAKRLLADLEAARQ